MAGGWWSEADNELLSRNMIEHDCRGESTGFCCAYHEGVADGIVAKGEAEPGSEARHIVQGGPIDSPLYADEPAHVWRAVWPEKT